MASAQTVARALLRRRFPFALDPTWRRLIIKLRGEDRLNYATDKEVDAIVAEDGADIEDLWPLPEDQEKANEFERHDTSIKDEVERVRHRIRRYIPLAEAYRAELAELNEEDLLEVRDDAATQDERRLQAELTKSDRFQFFNAKSADANYVFWCSLPGWTADEATALSFGKDPTVVTLARMLRLRNSLFSAEYVRRHKTVSRAFPNTRLAHVSIPASEFVDWAKRQHLNLPEEILKRVNRAPISTLVDDAAPSGEVMSGKSLKTIVLVLVGLGISKYGLDTDPYKGKKNSRDVAMAMVKDLKEVGIHFDFRTLENHLNGGFQKAIDLDLALNAPGAAPKGEDA